MSQLIDDLQEASDIIGDRRTVCCIGVFDGVHIGHQRLVGSAVAEALRRRKRSVLLTFPNHPLSLLAPPYAPALLTDPAEKAKRLTALRPSLVVMVPFDRDFADLEPEAFVEDVLVRQLGAASVWCGPDFRFGRGGRGDIQLLEECGQDCDLTAQTIDPVLMDSHKVSSTWIRSLIEEGQVETAAAAMDRPHCVGGRVVPGHKRGAGLGYPTANITPPTGIVMPGDGIYAGRIQVGKRSYGGMIHIGPLPTFDVAEPRFEAHLFDFRGNLLGKTIRIHFVGRLRDIERFDSPDDLVVRIRADEFQARRLLDQAGEE